MKAKAQAMSGAGLLVVATMCLALLGTIATACVMAAQGQEIPEALDRVLQGLLIGVPALLAKTYRDAPEEEPQEVEVVNAPEDPVPTTES